MRKESEAKKRMEVKDAGRRKERRRNAFTRRNISCMRAKGVIHLGTIFVYQDQR